MSGCRCGCGGKCSTGAPCGCARPPAHPDGDAFWPEDGEDGHGHAECVTRRPPILVPRETVLRCELDCEELRPAQSYWDCEVEALLSWGIGAGEQLVVEPPQTTTLLDREEEPVECGPSVRLADLFDREPVPAVAAVEDSLPVCRSAAGFRPRFSFLPVCQGPTFEGDPKSGPSNISPVAPDMRGKAKKPEIVLCTCVCTCLPPPEDEEGKDDPDAGTRGPLVDADPRERPFDPLDPFGFPLPPSVRDPRPPTRVLGDAPEGPPPPLGPPSFPVPPFLPGERTPFALVEAEPGAPQPPAGPLPAEATGAAEPFEVETPPLVQALPAADAVAPTDGVRPPLHSPRHADDEVATPDGARATVRADRSGL